MNQIFRFSSKTVLLFSAVWMIFSFYAIKQWREERFVWVHEMKSYYAYLPGFFVFDDVALEETEMTPYVYEHFYAPRPGPVRGNIMKTTMGVAFLQAPFFLTAHTYAKFTQWPSDGFCQPYRKMAVLAALFYSFLGLFFVRKTLRYFFTDNVVSLVLVTIFAGTNLYYYTFYEGAMSHVYSFFLISVFTYLTVSWHRVPSSWKLLLLGGILGLITLIRPVNLCVSLFFLLYRDASQISYSDKFKLLFSKWKIILVGGVLFFLALLPQLAYWKYTSGNWLYYSYGAETFFWFKPKIWLGLFSYQKGWLVWTPVMWFAVVGMLFLRKKDKPLFLPVAVSLVVYIYIIFSWWCWWYGGSFGMRAMIDVSAFLAIPLAAFFQYIVRSKIFVLPVLGLWLFLLSLNIFQIHQYTVGKIHWAGTTKKAYWIMFINDYPEEDYSLFNREPDVKKAMQGESGLD
jgi:hypothetical protein